MSDAIARLLAACDAVDRAVERDNYADRRALSTALIRHLLGGENGTAPENGATPEYTAVPGELDRLHGRLSRIAELHTKWAPSPYRLASCAECREPWPCPTHLLAATRRELATPPDLPGDQARTDAHAPNVAGEPTSTSDEASDE